MVKKKPITIQYIAEMVETLCVRTENSILHGDTEHGYTRTANEVTVTSKTGCSDMLPDFSPL